MTLAENKNDHFSSMSLFAVSPQILVKSMLKYHTFGSQMKIERIRSHSQPNMAGDAEEREVTNI